MPPLITRDSGLPSLGSTETNTLDFKARYKRASGPPFDTFEMAKDVAALANAMGGTLLVGAQEDETGGVLKAYLPLTESDAKETTTAFEQAVKDRCSPSPVVNIERIHHSNGYLLAVNVAPFPGQAVGVQVKGDKANGWGDITWVFPLRVGTQTKPLRPEQLAMLMSPEYRRISILLGDIKPGAQVYLEWPGSGSPDWAAFTFGSVQPIENMIVIQWDRNRQTIHIPIDRILSVWHDRTWRILIQGVLMQKSSGIFYSA